MPNIPHARFCAEKNLYFEVSSLESEVNYLLVTFICERGSKRGFYIPYFEDRYLPQSTTNNKTDLEWHGSVGEKEYIQEGKIHKCHVYGVV